ncbi:MAG: hypothetical protein H0V19_10815, partial [Euzebyales bacterium]|nr:hypothetical protein [Euzebyales bacterium]
QPPPPEPPQPYEPLAAEPLPNLKLAAARFAEALLTYPVGASSRDVVAAALGAAPATSSIAAVARVAAPLFPPGAGSQGRVIYPQFGGLQPLGPAARRASIMVVVEQRLVPDSGEPRSVTRTMDVRLRVDGGKWKAWSLYSAGGTEIPRPAGLPAHAARVLDDRRIELADTARWDVHAGLIDERVLRTMSAVAERLAISVAVLRTGHPYNVFGEKGRVSSHTVGRAVDVWAVDGIPVVEQARRGTPPWKVVGRLLDTRRVTQVGSPFDRDPPPPNSRSFSDTVHSDHIHIGVGPRRRR